MQTSKCCDFPRASDFCSIRLPAVHPPIRVHVNSTNWDWQVWVCFVYGSNPPPTVTEAIIIKVPGPGRSLEPGPSSKISHTDRFGRSAVDGCCSSTLHLLSTTTRPDRHYGPFYANLDLSGWPIWFWWSERANWEQSWNVNGAGERSIKFISSINHFGSVRTS